MRVGIGYDIHRLVAGRRLLLGGVELPHERGLLGHSDGDVLVHAVIDALLGAAALGDIGAYFPADEARWKDADSGELLRRVIKDLDAAGWCIENIDTTVIAEQPRLAPHIAAIRGRLAELAGMQVESVSVKVKSNERLGPIGEGHAIAAEAVALIDRRPGNRD
jgi:2-C-methyl-D-erythritol 2,4-cyclodiphosphate synthase